MHTPFAENQQRHNKDIPVSKSTNECLKVQLLWLDMKPGEDQSSTHSSGSGLFHNPISSQ